MRAIVIAMVLAGCSDPELGAWSGQQSSYCWARHTAIGADIRTWTSDGFAHCSDVVGDKSPAAIQLTAADLAVPQTVPIVPAPLAKDQLAAVVSIYGLQNDQTVTITHAGETISFDVDIVYATGTAELTCTGAPYCD